MTLYGTPSLRGPRPVVLRSCGLCGRSLEEWRDPLEPDVLVACGPCAVLWRATETGVELVDLGSLEEEARAIVADLVALFWIDRLNGTAAGASAAVATR